MNTPKHNLNYFRAGIFALVVSLGMTVESCKKEEPKAEDTKEVADDKNDAKYDDTKKEDDSEFVVKAAEINMNEIELGKLAQMKGTAQSVKDLGKMMEMEHTKALAELKDLAAKKNITIPAAATDEGKEKYKEFSEKKAADFDKDYASAMVDGHKDAISLFTKASTDSSDPDVKMWATNMLPSLNTHLQHAEQVKAGLK